MLRIVALTLALLVAGCSGGGDGSDEGASSLSGTTSGMGDVANRSAAPPVPMEHPVSWDGAVVAGAWLCEGAVLGGCRAAPSDAAFGVDHAIEGLAGNVSGDLVLSWTAETSATDQLVIDAYVLTPGCEDCAATQVGHEAGLSPLTVSLTAVVVPPGAVLRLSVYVDKYAEAPVGAAGVSGDQDFLVEGVLGMLP